MNYNQYRGGNILSNIPQVTRFILIANVVILALNFISKGLIGHFFQLNSFHLKYVPGHSDEIFKSYQLITHMFMHAGLGHLFFNMFGLYFFGRVLEQAIGSQKFFILYFISGLGAAALQLLIYYYTQTPAAMVGASGAVFGLLAAFAVMFPNVELMFMFIPVPIKAKYMVPIFAVLELVFGTVNFSTSNIAHFAHLGGAIFGFILVLIWKKNQFRQY